MNKIKFQDWDGKEHELPTGKQVTWRPSAYALIEHNNKTLLIKAKQHGKWELPGGGIEIGEKIAEGLIREVFEETGYKIKITEPTPFYIEEKLFYAPDVDTYWQAIPMFFKAKITDSKQETEKIDYQKEVTEVKWMSEEEISKKEIHLMSKKAIQQAK